MNSRLLYLDYARLFGAYFVIYGHLFPSNSVDFLRTSLFQFCMPLFFFISGFLHKHNGTIQWKKYAKTILVPALFFSTLFFFFIGPIFYYGYQPQIDTADTYIKDVTLLDTYIKLFGHCGYILSRYSALIDGPCWFLLTLFYCRVLTDLMEKYKYAKYVVLVFVVYVLFFNKSMHHHYCIENSAMAIPFYYLAFSCKEKIAQLVEKKFNPLFYVLALALFFTNVVYNGHISMWAVSFGNGGLWRPLSVLAFYTNGMIGTWLVIKFSTLFKEETFFSKMSYSLISILGMQLFFIAIYNIIFPDRLNHLLTIIPAVIILFLCYFCNVFLEKYMPFVLGKTPKKA